MMMNKKIQPGESLTVYGRFIDFNISTLRDSTGYEWIILTHSDAAGEYSNPVYVHPSSIPEICAALESACGLRRSEKNACRATRSAPATVRERRAGASWSAGEEALIVHLHLEGYDIREIAVRLGRSYGAITARLRSFGFIEDPKS